MNGQRKQLYSYIVAIKFQIDMYCTARKIEAHRIYCYLWEDFKNSDVVGRICCDVLGVHDLI